MKSMIVEIPGLCGGRPTIKGTRVEPYDVAKLYERHGIEEVRECFPHISDAQIKESIAYCKEHPGYIGRYGTYK
jgi:uncharacterized protein (DUF433 family)